MSFLVGNTTVRNTMKEMHRPKAGQRNGGKPHCWTAEHDALIRKTLFAKEVATRIGVSARIVLKRRRKLGVGLQHLLAPGKT